MKKIIVALSLVSAIATYSSAQTANTSPSTHKERQHLSPEEKAKKDTEKAAKTFTLSSDQKVKWESAALENAKANEPLRTKMEGSTTPADRAAIRDQMKSNKQKFNTTVSALLTPEQKTKYDQMKKEHRGHGHFHGKGDSQPRPQNGSSPN